MISRFSITHPFDRLSIKQDALFKKITSGIDVPYMDSPEIAIKDIENGPQASAGGMGTFRIRLSNGPDEVWQQVFERETPIATDAGPHCFEKDFLVFDCPVAALETHYRRIAAGVEQTNRAYKSERETVIARVRLLRGSETAAADKQAAENQEAQSAVDRLRAKLNSKT
jgi:hypothetical protein